MIYYKLKPLEICFCEKKMETEDLAFIMNVLIFSYIYIQ